MTTIQRKGKLTKLKDSCEACGKSKVKCSRDKPVCKRCAERQWPCVYGPSCRTGRHPRRQSMALAPIKRLPSRDEQHILDDVHNFRQSCPASTALYDPSTLHLLFSQVQKRNNNIGTRHNHSTLAYGSQGGSFNVIRPLAPDLRETNLNEQTNASRQIQNQPFTLPTNSYRLLPPNLDNIASASTQPLPDPPGFDSDRQFSQDHNLTRTRQMSGALSDHKSEDCLVSALHVLQRLFTASSSLPLKIKSCLSDRNPEYSATQTIRSALGEIQQIVHATEKILACKCSQDASLAILLTMAAFKMLEWYTSALDLLPSTTGTASSSTNPKTWINRCDASQRYEKAFRRESPIIEASTVTHIEASSLPTTLILGEVHAIRRVLRSVRVRLQEIELQGLDRATGAAKTTWTRDCTSREDSYRHIRMGSPELANLSSLPSVSALTTRHLVAELDNRYRILMKIISEESWMQ